jgi:diguanylate cyclase (GGDEF)-like protein
MNIFISELASNSKYPGISLILEMQIFMAEASYILAKKSMTEFPHRAYISALLSNISYFYISTFHPEEFEKILAQDSTSIKRMAAEWEIFGLDHAEISYLILGSSRVPSEIYEPVRYHHQKNLQISLGDNSTGNISLCTFFGSILTNMFYENFSLATEFRKDIKNLMGLYSDDLEDIIDEIIIAFRNRAKESGINKLDFPGYFKIISWFDTQMAMLGSEFEITRKKMTELNSQNLKYQKALEDNSRKLVGIALQDPLTGAFNRRYLGEKLSDEFLKAKRYGLNFTLISCDIDHFKNINDTYGHGYGDIVLIKLVQIIKSAIRKTDYIARIGGEEFLIVCHSSSGAGGYTIAEKIRKAIESTVFESEGNLIPVTMSFGVADYYPEVKSAEELIRISDERLYTAKNSGRNRVICK